MFDSRFVWTGAAVVVVAALAFALSSRPDQSGITPIAEPVSGIERQEAQKPLEKQEYAYMLKEVEGRVAVFRAGADEPEYVMEIYVKHLPDFDRSQMREGIPVKDYTQLLSLLEDYGS